MFKPMLAGKVESVADLRYPLLASPKLDGVRALVIDGRLVSRNLKPIPNAFCQRLFASLPPPFDGELIVGAPTASNCFRATTSGVMRTDGEPNVTFHVFDVCGSSKPFAERFAEVKRLVKGLARVKAVKHVTVGGAGELTELEERWLAEGYEGLMVRDPRGPYKFGRSTLREGWLLKLKRFEDSEAVVIDCVEQMANENEALRDELGRVKRSSAKAGKVGKGTLGALRVRDLKTGAEFDVGTGFDDALRKALWLDHTEARGCGSPILFPVIGRVIKYKFFPTGSKNLPRFPVFVGFRDSRDA